MEKLPLIILDESPVEEPYLLLLPGDQPLTDFDLRDHDPLAIVPPYIPDEPTYNARCADVFRSRVGIKMLYPLFPKTRGDLTSIGGAALRAGFFDFILPPNIGQFPFEGYINTYLSWVKGIDWLHIAGREPIYPFGEKAEGYKLSWSEEELF